MSDLEDKVSIITGASSGIGRSTAILFSKLGSKLVLVARNEEKLDETIDLCHIPDVENKILKIVGDITESKTIERIVDETLKQFKKIDVLVNNAGATKPGNLQNLKMEDYDFTMKINCKSIILLTQKCLPELIKQKGAIINVSSVSSTQATPELLSYCMSKSALDQFTKCLALEVADKQVRVNSVNPSTIQTNIFKACGASEERVGMIYEKCKSWHPIGRVGLPEEVAEAIAFLASGKASFITGIFLNVDGGKLIANNSV